MNVADSERRPVLGPACNKARRALVSRKASMKPQRKAGSEMAPAAGELGPTPDKKALHSPSPPRSPPSGKLTTTILRQHSSGSNHCRHLLLRSNLSLTASCSSDASTDSSHSRASTGRISRSSRGVLVVLKNKKRVSAAGKLEKVCAEPDDGVVVVTDWAMLRRKRCSWVTPNADPSYAAFHDEEWGVPVHGDKKLFELLSLSGALAELTWPVILSKRNLFREVFLDFDPVAVSNLNEKKIALPGTPANFLLSEIKLRAIIDNARQVCKVINEFGSFNQYIWGFVNQKPIINQFRYPRQVPVKTRKADFISKDLVKRGFRSVSPTVVYSFMQVAGLTNDHLIGCFRYEECAAVSDVLEKDSLKDAVEERKPDGVNMVKLELARALDEISLCSDL